MNILSIYRWPDLPRLLGLSVVYALLAKIALIANVNDTILCLPSGLALAALLIYGKKYWPGVFIGAFAISIMVGRPVGLATAIALGNTLAPWLGAWLLTRDGEFDLALNRLRDYFRLLLLGGVVGATARAIIGDTALLQAGAITLQSYPYTLLHWWVGVY
jgi:integral membrane sensor domain MASE1